MVSNWVCNICDSVCHVNVLSFLKGEVETSWIQDATRLGLFINGRYSIYSNPDPDYFGKKTRRNGKVMNNLQELQKIRKGVKKLNE